MKSVFHLLYIHIRIYKYKKEPFGREGESVLFGALITAAFKICSYDGIFSPGKQELDPILHKCSASTVNLEITQRARRLLPSWRAPSVSEFT